MNEKNDSRWWEFYGVRYAQGTVVGAMIVFFLFSQNQTLKKILFIPADPKDFGISHLILLAVYGLAYCYIASAPILIMHAGRGLLFKSTTNPNPLHGWGSRLLGVIIPSALVVYVHLMTSNPINAIKISTLFLFTMLISLQFQIILLVFTKSWGKTINYYLIIIKKRKKHTVYAESYKHLREHGNSFLIVFFQFLLALPIFIFVSQPDTQNNDALINLFSIILFWVSPAATIWFLGNKFENHLQTM